MQDIDNILLKSVVLMTNYIRKDITAGGHQLTIKQNKYLEKSQMARRSTFVTDIQLEGCIFYIIYWKKAHNG